MKIPTALMPLLFLAHPTLAQDELGSLKAQLAIKADWNGLPVMASTNEARVVVDYDRATFEVVFSASTLTTGVVELDSVLRTLPDRPISLQGKMMNMDRVETRDHAPLDFNAEARLSKKPDAPLSGKGHLEHVYAGRYACLLDLAFTVPSSSFGLSKTFPGLSGDLQFIIFQALLKRAND